MGAVSRVTKTGLEAMPVKASVRCFSPVFPVSQATATPASGKSIEPRTRSFSYPLVSRDGIGRWIATSISEGVRER